MSIFQSQAIAWLKSIVKNCPASYTYDKKTHGWTESNNLMFPDSNRVYDYPHDISSQGSYNGPVAIITPAPDPSHVQTDIHNHQKSNHHYLIIQLVQGQVNPDNLRDDWHKGIKRWGALRHFLSINVSKINDLCSWDIFSYEYGFELQHNRYIFKIMVVFSTNRFLEPLPAPVRPPGRGKV